VELRPTDGGGLDLHVLDLHVLDCELGGLSVASCDERVRRYAVALGFELVPAA
jgi:hypothetical protein